jgi:hypothetical protein
MKTFIWFPLESKPGTDDAIGCASSGGGRTPILPPQVDGVDRRSAYDPRMRALPRVLGLFILAAAAIGGCDLIGTPAGASAAPAPNGTALTDANAATKAEVFGPWSPTPFQLAASLVTSIDTECRKSLDPFPSTVQLVVVDARGAGVAQVYYAADDGAEAACFDVVIRGDGRAEPSGAGRTKDPGEPHPPMGQFALAIVAVTRSGDPVAETSQVEGRVGAGVARVEIVRPSESPIQASLANGWFAGWIRGLWPDGWHVVGYDATGVQVADAAGHPPP